MVGTPQIGDSAFMALSIDELPDDVASLKALLLAARAASDAAEARSASLAAEVARLTARAERLDHIVSVLRRAQFGRRSERIADDQIELALEDVETQHAAEDAAVEKADTIAKAEGSKARRANRGRLPSHLPREEIVIEPPSKTCPCCGGALHVIGEDVSERLDKIPARLRVIVTRRPKYACRSCTDGIVQAPAPNRLVEGGLPTEALVADVLVSSAPSGRLRSAARTRCSPAATKAAPIGRSSPRSSRPPNSTASILTPGSPTP